MNTTSENDRNLSSTAATTDLSVVIIGIVGGEDALRDVNIRQHDVNAATIARSVHPSKRSQQKEEDWLTEESEEVGG